MNEETKIEELKAFSAEDLEDMESLMQALSATSHAGEAKLKAAVSDPNGHVYVHRNEQGRIVAQACLCVAHTTEFTLGFVEAVVVLPEYRGQHLGRAMMERIIKDAPLYGVESLHLTSSAKRVAANALYRKLGFEYYDTNVYKMKL